MLWNRIYKIKNSIDVYLVDEEYVLFYFMNTRARKRFRVNETVINLNYSRQCLIIASTPEKHWIK